MLDKKQKEQQRKNLEVKIGKLRYEELSLINLIRTTNRYGEIIIKTRDGFPVKVIERIIYRDLDE